MKILIPLDGSKFAEAVLKPTADLAAATKAEVHLIEVVRLSETREMYTELSSPNPHGAMGAKAQVEERLYQTAQDYLNDIAQRFFPGGATSKIVISESPVKEILDYARQEKVDLIAIATHGRTGRARLLLGSVAGELLKAHVAPIFMVRPEGLS